MEILGYVECTSPGCNEAMEVSRCNGKRSAFLKGRCNACHCTEQRSNANTQDYLKQYVPLDALKKPEEVQPEEISTPPQTQQVQPEVPNQDPKPRQEEQSKGISGWLCAGIGAGLGLAFGKAVTVLKAI